MSNGPKQKTTATSKNNIINRLRDRLNHIRNRIKLVGEENDKTKFVSDHNDNLQPLMKAMELHREALEKLLGLKLPDEA